MLPGSTSPGDLIAPPCICEHQHSSLICFPLGGQEPCAGACPLASGRISVLRFLRIPPRNSRFAHPEGRPIVERCWLRQTSAASGHSTRLGCSPVILGSRLVRTADLPRELAVPDAFPGQVKTLGSEYFRPISSIRSLLAVAPPQSPAIACSSSALSGGMVRHC